MRLIVVEQENAIQCLETDMECHFKLFMNNTKSDQCEVLFQLFVVEACLIEAISLGYAKSSNEITYHEANLLHIDDTCNRSNRILLASFVFHLWTPLSRPS